MNKNLSYLSLTGHQVDAWVQLEITGLLEQNCKVKELMLTNLLLGLTRFILQSVITLARIEIRRLLKFLLEIAWNKSELSLIGIAPGLCTWL